MKILRINKNVYAHFFVRVLTLIQEDEVGIKEGMPVQEQEKDMIRTRL